MSNKCYHHTGYHRPIVTSYVHDDNVKVHTDVVQQLQMTDWLVIVIAKAASL